MKIQKQIDRTTCSPLNIPKQVKSNYNVEPTPKQIKTVNAILAGQTSISKAMMQAGYSVESSRNPKQNFYASKGLQTYLETLDFKSRLNFNKSILDKALEVYMHAIDATKISKLEVQTQNATVTEYIELPDHDIRMKAADRVVTLFNQIHPSTEEQYAPAITDEEKKDFNDKFLKFVNSGEFFNTEVGKAR